MFKSLQGLFGQFLQHVFAVFLAVFLQKESSHLKLIKTGSFPHLHLLISYIFHKFALTIFYMLLVWVNICER